jgi:hypothetical protein
VFAGPAPWLRCWSSWTCFGECLRRQTCCCCCSHQPDGLVFHASQRERELELQLSQKAALVKDLHRKVEEMEADVREVQSLRDEVDVLRPAATALAKAEVELREIHALIGSAIVASDDMPFSPFVLHGLLSAPQATNARYAKQLDSMDELQSQFAVCNAPFRLHAIVLF